MFDRNALMNSLKNSLVEIRFYSMNSGEEKKVIGSLNKKFLNNHMKMNQDQSNDSILIYKPESGQWEDIRLDSIIDWVLINDQHHS